MRFLLMSHGPMAQGALESAQMIVGQQETVHIVSVSHDSTIDTTFEDIVNIVSQYDNEDWLFITDIIGGTPFNAAYRYIEEYNKDTAIITGFNLPLLLELFMRSNDSLDSILDYINTQKEQTISVVTVTPFEQEETFDL